MIEFDTEELSKSIMELEPKHRLKTIKGAFRKAANKVRKKAVANLRESKIRTDKDLEKGIRSAVWRKTPGFRVTIGTKRANKKGKGERGFHLNRRGLKKPVLIWAEEGTKDRKTKTRYRFLGRKMKGHATGKMPSYRFMEKTQREMKNQVTDELQKALGDSIIKALKKYGSR